MSKLKYHGILILLLVFNLALTSSCHLIEDDHLSDQEDGSRQEITTVQDSGSQSDKTIPTGYSDGGIGFSSIYYDGQLFRLEEIVGELSENKLAVKLIDLGAEKVGTIITETNHRWPSADLEASRLPVSLPVYYDQSNKLLYVVSEDGELRLLEPYLEELYDLEAKK